MASARYKFEQFAATRIYYPVVAYAPNGREIAHVTNTTGQFNLWTLPSGGGFARQLTAYTDNTVRGVAWSPDSRQILFTTDQDGDEFTQVYLTGREGGLATQLTNVLTAQHQISPGAWSPDGKKFAYAANDLDPEHVTVTICTLRTGEKVHPFPLDSQYYSGGWSPDGRYLMALEFRGNTDQSLHVYDTQTGSTRHLTPHEGNVQHWPFGWSADSAGFYYTTDQDREFLGMMYYSLSDGRSTPVDLPEMEVENAGLSSDGSTLIWSVNVDGASQLRGRDLTTGRELPMPELPPGELLALDVHPKGRRVALVFSTASEAPNLFELDLKTGKLRALGQSMLGGIPQKDMIHPERISYPTFDGRDIPAWLYRPRGSGKFPIVVSIHGGPEAQERPRYVYMGLYQYLLNRGFGILAPNIRGSTGYGKTYQALIHRDWGGAELRDIEHAAKYLRTLDWVDSNRIAIFGGSFGGFATLSALSRLPEYWALGVDFVGPSNLITFVDSVPPHWKQSLKDWVGDAVEDRDMLIERSPITHVKNIRVPLLVIQGAKDPRVVKAESDQMVEQIRRQGGDVTYYVDENEGHGATRRENALKWYRMMAEYLEDNLLDEPSDR